MIEWSYIVLGLSVLLLSFLLWKETRRPNKARLIWRVLATILAVTSFACLTLPLTYRHLEKVSTNQKGVLLTDGFSTDSINRFLSTHNNDVPVFTADKNVKDGGKFNAVYIADVSHFSQHFKDITTLHVFGYGLKTDELAALKDVSINFHPAELSPGITAINWSRKIKTGEKLLVQGTINNSAFDKVKIILRSFNNTLDSTTVSRGGNEKFQLATIPKNIGRSVYSLILVAGRDTLEKELVPVEVEQGESLKILILASSPDFDNKFLKERLSQKGYAVVARTTISKNKFQKDFLNTQHLAVDRITPALLDGFDITIADAAALSSISGSEVSAIQNQVAQKGMGLIIKADSANNRSAFFSGLFPLSGGTTNSPSQVNLYLSDSSESFPPISLENLLFIRDQPRTIELVSDKQNRSFASTALYGSGKIIVTTVAGTFSWALAGFQNDYDKFWSELLSNVASEPIANEVWTSSPLLPQVNYKVDLKVQTNDRKVPNGQIGETAVYLEQNASQPYQWTGNYYPATVGWQTGIQISGSPFYWYAFGPRNWKTIRASETINSTKKYINNKNNINKISNEESKTIESEIPKWIFFLFFLLFAGFLWFENKI